ncbi:MAG: aminotransferase class V-fold PLP-dependent enzyme [Candidatus Thorarchaeota archaeon]|nr:aminotransferase class V-fold PLP-dependent enzyme [Candidatus Thorarchaeota archaeon]
MTPIVAESFVESNFPTLKDMTYLNTASTGIAPVSMREAVVEYLENSSKAIGSFQETLDLFKAVRSKLAKLLGGKTENYGLVTSTSDGLNAAAQGINYPKGSNIVICDLEFPSNYIPWQQASRLYGAELRVVRSHDGAASVDDFVRMMDDNTAVVAVSHVQFGSGYRMDLKRISEEVHKRGGLLVADVIQSAGWADYSLVDAGVDFAAAQAAKWMIGPIGAGFVYVSDRAMERFTPRYLGWWGVEGVEDFTYKDKRPLGDARKFQIGSPAMMAFVGIQPSLDVLLALPAKVRERAAMECADHLRKRLRELRIPYYEFGEKNNSPIVSCKVENADEVNKRLFNHRIHCSVRNGRLRVSPHFYNTVADIDRLVEQLR